MKYFDHWTTAVVGIPALIMAIVALICAGYQAFEHFARLTLVLAFLIITGLVVWLLVKIGHVIYAIYQLTKEDIT